MGKEKGTQRQRERKNHQQTNKSQNHQIHSRTEEDLATHSALANCCRGDNVPGGAVAARPPGGAEGLAPESNQQDLAGLHRKKRGGESLLLKTVMVGDVEP